MLTGNLKHWKWSPTNESIAFSSRWLARRPIEQRSERRSIAPDQEQLERGDHNSQRQPRRHEKNVKPDDIHDYRREDHQRKRHHHTEQQQRSSDYLDAKDQH